jgi:hypothetical protein
MADLGALIDAENWPRPKQKRALRIHGHDFE